MNAHNIELPPPPMTPVTRTPRCFDATYKYRDLNTRDGELHEGVMSSCACGEWEAIGMVWQGLRDKRLLLRDVAIRWHAEAPR